MKLFDKIEYFTLYLMLDVAKKKKKNMQTFKRCFKTFKSSPNVFVRYYSVLKQSFAFLIYFCRF